MKQINPVKPFVVVNKWLFFILCFILTSGYRAVSQVSTPIEYQVKSLFLFNFSKFVTWPAPAFNGLQSPFVIVIMGDDPFGSFLDETIAGEKVMDHPVIVKRYKSVAEIDDCHILFIAQKETVEIQNVLEYVNNRSTLTVGDAANFTTIGGMIAFITVHNKIRFQVNVKATKAAELVISSKLLRLAEIENRLL